MTLSDLAERVEGWKNIADAVGRGVTWCKRAAKRDDELRLPVYRISNGERAWPCLDVVDLASWREKWKAAGGSTLPIGDA